MNKSLVLLAVLALSTALLGSAYAHKGQVVGDYKIEVGWKNEPAIVGKKNAIELVVTKTTISDKKSNHDSHENGKKTPKTVKTFSENPAGIHLVSTKAKSEHKHDSAKSKKSTGISGLSKTLEADITLNGKKTFLNIIEDKNKKGTYYGDYTPTSAGYPTIHIVGKIKNTPVELSFHPEKVQLAITKTD